MSDDDARKERDKGIARVRKKSEPFWSWAWFVYVSIPVGWEGQFEDINNIVRARIGEPEYYGIHPNVFGSLSMHAIQAGLFESTGEYRHTKNRKSHTRPTPIYVRTRYRPFFQPPIPLPPAPLRLLPRPTQEPFAAFKP